MGLIAVVYILLAENQILWTCHEETELFGERQCRPTGMRQWQQIKRKAEKEMDRGHIVDLTGLDRPINTAARLTEDIHRWHHVLLTANPPGAEDGTRRRHFV